MTCAIPSRWFAVMLLVAALSSAAVPGRSLQAQQPPTSPALPSPTATPTTPAPYRVPLIALVQPPSAAAPASATGSVPRDRPVVVFRFAAGEPDDPLDIRSLMVVVDGADRTTLFKTGADEAWGPLADAVQLAKGELAVGQHRIAARICSARGACGSTEMQVLVVPGIVSDTPATTPLTKPRRVMDAVIGVARRLLAP